MAGIRQHPWAREELGEVCCAIDSHVDRTFIIEVLFISTAQKFLRAVHHEPKFSSNTRRVAARLIVEARRGCRTLRF
jgi:hypothetical protein